MNPTSSHPGYFIMTYSVTFSAMRGSATNNNSSCKRLKMALQKISRSSYLDPVNITSWQINKQINKQTDFEDVIKLRILRWEDYPELPWRGPKCNHKCLYRKKTEGSLTQKRRYCGRGVMQLQAKECQQTPAPTSHS